jgi:ketopantoate reductase
MKILIYGAGIVGCTYGWQLSEAGHDLSVLVRKEKKQKIDVDGIAIHCTDFRGGQKQIKQTVFRPKVINELSSLNDFEYIIVSTNNLHLKDVLPVLAKSAGKAHILFFQNMWKDDFDEIANYLSPEQYFFGFPFMVGGGRDSKSIYCAISGLKYSHTPLGELNGEITPRVQKIAKALEDANLKPIISTQISVWLITHYAVAAGLSAGIITAGGAKVFVSDSKIIKETIKSIREGLEVCLKRGINPKSEKANRLYYLPLFISVAIARKVYSDEALTIMFDGFQRKNKSLVERRLASIVWHSPFLPSLKLRLFRIGTEVRISYICSFAH